MDTQELLDRVAGTVLQTMAALPASVQRWLTPAGLSTRDGQELEPEVGMALRLLSLSGESPSDRALRKQREQRIAQAQSTGSQTKTGMSRSVRA